MTGAEYDPDADDESSALFEMLDREDAQRERQAAQEEELAAWLDDAPPPEPSDDVIALDTHPPGRGRDKAGSVPLWLRASEVRETTIGWLWLRRLPRGVLALLEGIGGLGKSTIAVDLAARVSAGRPMPGEDAAKPPRGVVWISSEESASAVIIPRLRVAGADLRNIIVRNNEAERWTTAKGCDELRALIEEHDIALVVIDALKDHTIGKDHEEGEVRRALAPLVQVARSTGACVLGIRHWTKAPREASARGAGSTAYRDVARSVLQLGKRPDGLGLALAQGKTNYAARAPTLAVTLDCPPGETVPCVDWGEEIDVSADDIATFDPTAKPAHSGRSKEGAAAAAIREILSDGPAPSQEVKLQVAGQVGCGIRTVEGAARRVGVVTDRPGFGMPVRWRLPMRASSSKHVGCENDETIDRDATERVQPHSQRTVGCEYVGSASEAQLRSDLAFSQSSHT